MHNYYFQYIFLFAILSSVVGEYFTSSTHLNDLLRTEIQLSSQLKRYVEKKDKMLDKLKTFYTINEDTGKYITERNATVYVGDPLYSYSCIQRWVSEWTTIKSIANEKSDILFTLQRRKEEFPKEEDLDGAKNAILRLQETFALPSKNIVNGFTDGDESVPKLSIEDAYDFGMKAYEKQDIDLSRSWMRETLRLIRNTTKRYHNDEILFNVLDVLSWVENEKGNIKEAYELTKELLEVAPNHKRIQQNLVVLQGEIEGKTEMTENLPYKKQQKATYKPFYYTQDEDDANRYFTEIERANALCRGETKPVEKKFEKYLCCWFKKDDPRLILKPAKVERIYPKPEILMFRDAIRETTMQRIKDLSNPLLNRATVNNPFTGKLEFANYRVSKSAWLSEEDDADLLKQMNNRIESYTGLDMQTAESIQVANYGIGGYYEPHFDFARTVPLRPPPWRKRDNYTIRTLYANQHPDTELGERIATMLFYMSDVELGGATVFTNIGQAIKPSKGDAVFWYNLNHDGSGDYETRHSACPILFGEKWVSNRWLHEYGQEFRRPCKLRIEDDW